MEEIFTTRNVLIYLAVINIFGFLVMLIDKHKAKKGSWRIPEKTIFFVTLLGGGIGTITGMYKFRHKTKKMGFVIGLPCITILEILIYVVFKYL